MSISEELISSPLPVLKKQFYPQETKPQKRKEVEAALGESQKPQVLQKMVASFENKKD